jgi:hypothetical protein
MKTLKLVTALLFFTHFTFGQRYIFDTTFVNKNHKFHVSTKDINDSTMLLSVTDNSKVYLKETIYGGLGDIHFLDFDKDGYTDIQTEYFGNNSTYYLYLFDSKTNKFKSIEGFDKYPEAVPLKSNPKYYYSYHRAGCADANWVSDLFKIVNFKTVQLGHIYGRGCDFEVKQNPQVIEIYKVRNNDEENGKLIAKLPYLKFIPNFGDKWDFIKKYWSRSYRQFE